MKTLGVIAVLTLLSILNLQVMGDDPKPPPRYTCECSKNGGEPVLFMEFCRCATCPKVDQPIVNYDDTCRTQNLIDFEKDLAAKCTGIENTEDCEFFKATENVRGGKVLTEGFKKCRDVYDSIKDDCEDAEDCCYVLDDPKQVEEEEKSDD